MEEYVPEGVFPAGEHGSRCKGCVEDMMEALITDIVMTKWGGDVDNIVPEEEEGAPA